MSPARHQVLDRLREQSEPLTLAALAAATGLHMNTVREHLEGLVQAGLVRRFTAAPSGRGRPAWLHQPTVAGETYDGSAGSSEYASLATALAETIADTSPDPRREAEDAGRRWGRSLVRERAASAATPEQARERVVALLDGLGFAPTAGRDAAEVRLTRCPLLAAARRQSEVVCGVHLGIVRGALEQLGAPSAATVLEPFAVPGACRLVVPPLVGAAR